MNVTIGNESRPGEVDPATSITISGRPALNSSLVTSLVRPVLLEPHPAERNYYGEESCRRRAVRSYLRARG